MQKSKLMKKFFMLALAVALVFTVAMPVAAQDYFTTTNASYIQGTAPTYSSPINVTLGIESRTISGNYIYDTRTVTLTPSGTQSFYVRDVLLAVQAAGYYTFKDSSGNVLDASDSYFYSVTDNVNNTGTYAPTSLYAWDGWVFRINGQYPLLSAGLGACIADAYVTAGDVINIYHDDVSSSSTCADFAKITSITDDNTDDLTVNVKASCQYYGPAPNYTWYLSNFANYSGVTVNAYDENYNLVASGTTNGAGNVTLNVGAFGSHTYTVEVQRSVFGTGLIQNTSDYVTGYDPI